MSSRRTLSWSTALSDLRADRETPNPVREERLRTGLRRHSGIALSAWRGRSARRYVVGIHDLAGFDLADFSDAVILAVARDAAGFGQILRATADLDPIGFAMWLDSVRRAGATEIHTHRFAETAAERTAVVFDLTDGRDAPSLAA